VAVVDRCTGVKWPERDTQGLRMLGAGFADGVVLITVTVACRSPPPSSRLSVATVPCHWLKREVTGCSTRIAGFIPTASSAVCALLPALAVLPE